MVIFFIALTAGTLSFFLTILPSNWQIACLTGLLLVLGSAICGRPKEFLFGLLVITLGFRIDKILISFPYMGGTAGLRIALEDVLLVCLFFISLVNYRGLSQKTPNLVPRVSIPFLLFYCFSAISYLASDRPLSGFALLMDFARGFTVFLVAVNYFTNERRVYQGVVLVAITIALEGIIALVQYHVARGIPGLGILGQHDNIYQEAWLGSDEIRAGGTLGGPNDLALYVVLLLPLVTAVLVHKSRLRSKLIAVISIFFGISALVVTFSRTGWICFGLGMMILCLLLMRRIKLAKLVPMAAVVASVGGLVSFLYLPLIELRVSSDDRGSAYSRIPLMLDSFYAVRDNVITGVGINNYSSSILKYDVSGVYNDSNGRGFGYPVHNIFLLHFAEVGVLGGIVFCWFWLGCFVEVGQAYLRGNNLTSVVAAGFFAGMLGQLGFYQTQWGYLGSYLPFWVGLALAIGMKNRPLVIERSGARNHLNSQLNFTEISRGPIDG